MKPQKNSNFMQGLKSAILTFFRMGRDGCALLVRPLIISHRILKNIFVLGSYESLERLKGKIVVASSFKGSIY
jgi:hypothetical protein